MSETTTPDDDASNPLEVLAEYKNGKVLRFVQEYHIHGNATKAAIAAGYAESGARQRGSEMYKLPEVKAALRYLNQRLIDSAMVTADKVRKDIEQVRQQALETGNLGVAVKCSELQGKTIAMFKDGLQHSGNVVVRKRFMSVGRRPRSSAVDDDLDDEETP